MFPARAIALIRCRANNPLARTIQIVPSTLFYTFSHLPFEPIHFQTFRSSPHLTLRNLYTSKPFSSLQPLRPLRSDGRLQYSQPRTSRPSGAPWKSNGWCATSLLGRLPDMWPQGTRKFFRVCFHISCPCSYCRCADFRNGKILYVKGSYSFFIANVL